MFGPQGCASGGVFPVGKGVLPGGCASGGCFWGCASGGECVYPSMH